MPGSGASSNISSEIGRKVAIFLTGSEVSPKTSVDSGFGAPSEVGAAALVAVVSETNLTGLPGASWVGIKSARYGRW